MLNTDAHNPNIKKKMTEQEFVRTNRGINEGQDIVPEYLIDIYCRIVTNEIKMEHESFPDALKMGWLWIKGTHHTHHRTHHRTHAQAQF
jgi:Sec7-like guanine-nucleotide exchange factor